ncbi:hypothetical protein [Flavobacterium nitrogenifigens]|uniref:Uncharacterized protein n=1 Tax=Flavobacterium nitrogenifigens TaxID=1617283 RepID=A0A521EWJ8_9FLAO|nr:hypothetical protein [Flavobacterium nitrogenifigens]KAF2333333.1 hypothetical protein DM397_09310 [Flavobacterium nitrogenifigens]SMO88305.1 hypothetical protein SAMN06265220_105190 [Flavobacterium nitrogenifigens]
MKNLTCMLLLICSGFVMAQTKTVVTQNGEKVTISPTVDNGLTATNGHIQLGGALTKPSVLATTSAFTLAFTGLQTGGASDNVLVTDASGVLKYVPRSSFSGADNLGNHIATQDLNLSNFNLLNIKNAYIKNDLQIFDRITSNTNYFGIYKNQGKFGIWNNVKSTNALTIDESNNKTTLLSAQITAGTNGSAPQTGYMLTAADPSGNLVFTAPKAIPGAISGVYEFLGTDLISIPANTTATIPMNANSFTMSTSGKALITYSVLPLPANASQPVQGSIDLIIDNTKMISSYYSATDSPSTLVKLGNYSTAQKMISLPAGTHTVGVNLKSWSGTTRTNVNPFPSYVGSIANDNQAMVARITVITFND